MMAVREALLTLLVVGENYGFRLHNELTRRVPSRASLNVGQTYATLERAGIAGLITDAGMNAEGLPQYRLTDAGLKVVNEWLLGADAPATRPDDETIERLFLVMSLPNWDSYSSVSRTAVLDSEQSRWTKRASEALGVSALDTVASPQASPSSHHARLD